MDFRWPWYYLSNHEDVKRKQSSGDHSRNCSLGSFLRPPTPWKKKKMDIALLYEEKGRYLFFLPPDWSKSLAMWRLYLDPDYTSNRSRASKVEMEIISCFFFFLFFKHSILNVKFSELAGKYLFWFYHLQRLGLELQSCMSHLMNIRKTLIEKNLPLFSLGTSQIKSTVSAG